MRQLTHIIPDSPVNRDGRTEGSIEALPHASAQVHGDQHRIRVPQGGSKSRVRASDLPEVVRLITENVIGVLEAKQPRLQLPAVGNTLLNKTTIQKTTSFRKSHTSPTPTRKMIWWARKGYKGQGETVSLSLSLSLHLSLSFSLSISLWVRTRTVLTFQAGQDMIRFCKIITMGRWHSVGIRPDMVAQKRVRWFR